MSHPVVRNLGLVAAVGLTLAGCDAIKKVSGPADETSEATAAATPPASPAKAVGADVEAPEAYQTTD